MILQNISDLVLIRHGESKRNILEKKSSFYKSNADRESVGIFQDRRMPLTKKGCKQAKNAGKGLKRKFGVPDILFYSGFLRTEETAAGILKAYSHKEWARIKVMENHLVRERNPGYLMFPWWQSYWYYADPLLTMPIGGESMVSMAEGRLTAFLKSLEDLFYKKGGKKIYVTSHGRAILGMRYLLEDWSYERMISALAEENPPNCSVTAYSFDPEGKPVLQFANKVFR